MDIEIIKTLPNLARCVYSVAEAAQAIGVSESTMRRNIRAVGVNRVSGPTVAGYIQIQAQPVALVLPYYA